PSLRPVFRVVASYFSSYPLAPRPPPSFPTRRSSDLAHVPTAQTLGHRVDRDDDTGGDRDDAGAERQRPRSKYGPRRLHRVQRSQDRKSTRLNSSHVKISYAVFCLKKKTNFAATCQPV